MRRSSHSTILRGEALKLLVGSMGLLLLGSKRNLGMCRDFAAQHTCFSIPGPFIKVSRKDTLLFLKDIVADAVEEQHSERVVAHQCYHSSEMSHL